MNINEIPEEIRAAAESFATKMVWVNKGQEDEHAFHEYISENSFLAGYRLALDQIAALQKENERLKEELEETNITYDQSVKDIEALLRPAITLFKQRAEKAEAELSSLKEQGDGWFHSAVGKWMQWTKDNFPMSGTKASLIHLQEEIKEVLEVIDDVSKREHHEGIALMEFADCFICLLTASGKSGFTIQQIEKAVANKMEINYERKWRLNPDNTYSHIKPQPPKS